MNNNLQTYNNFLPDLKVDFSENAFKTKNFKSEIEAINFLNKFIRFHNSKTKKEVLLRKLQITIKDLVDIKNCNFSNNSYIYFEFNYKTRTEGRISFWNSFDEELKLKKAILKTDSKYYVTPFGEWYFNCLQQYLSLKLESKN